MRSHIRVLVVSAAVALVSTGFGTSLDARARLTAERSAEQLATARSLVAGVPLHFESNKGQTAPQVRFVARTRGHTAFLLDSAAVLVPRGRTAAPVRMSFSAARRGCRSRGALALPGESHYLRGNDPERWIRHVPHFGGVVVPELYPGVDLHWTGEVGRRLRYDLVVAPGADPSTITIAFEGIDSARIDEQGDLLLETAAGELRHTAPVLHQEIDGARRDVEGRFELRGASSVGFEVTAYDPAVPLVIDPTMIWSTYHGGTDGDNGQDVAVDATGAVYVVGTSSSANFPPAGTPFQGTLAPSSDVVVSKLDPGGQLLVFTTYIGGDVGGGGVDFGSGIDVDNGGNVYVTGTAQSTDFPTTVGAFQTTYGGGFADAFVAKVLPDGSDLVYSTFLGGRERDSGHGVAVDGSGHAFVTGATFSPAFPTASPIQPGLKGFFDGFVTKVAPDGATLVYSTFLGGTSGDQARGIAVVGSPAEACVVGFTLSDDFPTTVGVPQTAFGGSQDAFVTKVNGLGTAHVFSTFLGGGGTDTGGGDNSGGVAMDDAGNVYVTGMTESQNFPVTPGAAQGVNNGLGDAFVAKYSASGAILEYATFLGGTGAENGEDIAIRGAGGTAYVTGRTTSTNFPTVFPLQAAYAGGDSDAFVTRVAASGGNFQYSTYLGGSGPPEGGVGNDSGHGIATDDNGNAYVVGDTDGKDFPTKLALQPSVAGSADSWIAKINDTGTGPLAIGAATLPDGELTVPYNASLQINGGQPPYVVTVQKGALPTGVNVDNAGDFNGTPTKAKKFRFSIQVRDNAGAVANQDYQVRIFKALVIKTKAFKNGRVGKNYRGKLKAKGGAKPYSWSIPSANLPAGLNLNTATGKITGTPTASATSDLTCRVDDKAGGKADRVIPLVIDPPKITGTYKGQGQWTLAACQTAGNNGTQPHTATVKINKQTGATFGGTIQLTSTVNGAKWKTKCTLTAGNLTNDKDIAGTFDYTIKAGKQTVSSGDGNFAGTVIGGVVTINITGQPTSGETCTFDGDVTAQ